MNLKIETFTTLLWLATNRTNPSGLAPIFLRITVNGKRAEVATKISIDPKHWDAKKQSVKPIATDSIVKNNFLEQLKGRVQMIFNQLMSENKTITASSIKDELQGNKARTKTLNEVFEYHQIKMSEQVKAGLVVAKTLLRYEITHQKVKKFMLTTYRNNDIPLDEIKMRFVTEFEHYLLTKEKLQENTAHKYIKNLKKMMNLAVSMDWLQSNPFINFKCTYRPPHREVLSLEEVTTIRMKDFKNERLNEIRDVFVFCCYTGFAYSDINDFPYNAVMKGLDGNYWLSTFRKKTGTKESVPLLPIAQEIIQRYVDHEYCKEMNKLLPVKSNQRYNAYLKEIQDICNISKPLTTHIARHTFATTITLANGVPIETVSAMLGHQNIRTTQIYAKVLQNKVSEDMQALKSKLEEKTTVINRKEA